MALTSVSRHRARYLIPLGAAAITAVVVIAPQAASGAQHPDLAPRTASQLLASLEQAHVPQFSGTTVETARLGLPSLDDANLPGVSIGGQSQLAQIFTLLTGSHTAQIAYGGSDRQRVAIFLSDLSETDVVHNGSDLWTYSSDGDSYTHASLGKDSEPTTSPADNVVDPTRAAERALAEINPSTAVTVDRTAEVAGRPAYQLDLAPRDSRSLVSSVRIALDSATWLPLRVEIWSRQNASEPAFSVGFTSISMKAPSASTFSFTPPPNATNAGKPFSELGLGESDQAGQPGAGDGSGHQRGSPTQQVLGKDWTSVFVEQLSSSERAALPGAVPQSVGTSAPGASGAPPQIKPAGGDLAGVLNQFATKVAAGHLITTTLFSILITNDNRILIGAVTPAYLEQVATASTAQ
jgi:outer membrane lipoprotein-sorting protein